MNIAEPTFAPGLSQPPESFETIWRRLPRLGRAILWFLLAVIVVQTASSLVQGISGNANGITGKASSFDTSSSGTAALAQLISQNGHSVVHLSSDLSPESLATSTTLFSLDAPRWNSTNTRGVLEVLRRGGMVVLSGRSASIAMLNLLAPSVHATWHAARVGTANVSVAAGIDDGVRQLNSPGVGSFSLRSLSPGLNVLARGPGGILAVALHQRGWLVALASSSPLLNAQLATADDAAFALDLANVQPSPVTFDEYSHGVGQRGQGLAGLPAPWRFGLGALVLSLIVWIISAARRMGAPQVKARRNVPPRIGYVDAMATLLRTRPSSEVIAVSSSVRSELRSTLARRFGLPRDANDETLTALSTYSSPETGDFTEIVARAVSEPASDTDLVGVGRALSALRRTRSSH